MVQPWIRYGLKEEDIKWLLKLISAWVYFKNKNEQNILIDKLKQF